MWARISLAVLAAAVWAAVAALGGKPRVEPVAKAPVAYFESHCRRCHGPVDSPVNTAFEEKLPVDKLRKAVADMAAGPGGDPLAGRNLDALVALHQAMNSKSPFVVWTGSRGGRLTGEVSPGAKVTATAKGKPVAVTLKGFTWTVVLPTKTAPSAVVLKASRSGRTVELRLSERAWR